jgi:hypothetical protein
MYGEEYDEIITVESVYPDPKLNMSLLTSSDSEDMLVLLEINLDAQERMNIESGARFGYLCGTGDYSDICSLPIAESSKDYPDEAIASKYTPSDLDELYSLLNEIETFIYAEQGSEVYALCDGEVVLAEYYYGFGNAVVVKSAEDSYIFYSHLGVDGFRVDVGDTVSKGQLIGLSGTTGDTNFAGVGYTLRSEAPHFIE